MLEVLIGRFRENRRVKLDDEKRKGRSDLYTDEPIWKNPRKAVQPFENKKRKIGIFKNYEANGVEKIQRKLEIFSTLISKKSSQDTRL